MSGAGTDVTELDVLRGDNCLLHDEIERLRERAKRLKEANDGNHRRAVNAERDVARLRARHDEKNAEAHAKHTLLGELIDALSDDLTYEISASPTVASVVRRAIVTMDDDRYRSYLDAWWLA
jgi:hypothetical protein